MFNSQHILNLPIEFGFVKKSIEKKKLFYSFMKKFIFMYLLSAAYNEQQTEKIKYLVELSVPIYLY